jgi:hypothetical protein
VTLRLVIEVDLVRPGPIRGDAAAFALIACASSWIKCWHPDVFCASLLNAQPMGWSISSAYLCVGEDHCMAGALYAR